MEHFLPKLYLLLVLLCVTSIECNLESLYERQSSVNSDDEEQKNGGLTWHCPLRDSAKSFNESNNWNNFLCSLYCKFSEYKMQVAKRNYRVNNSVEFRKQDCAIEELIHEVKRIQIDENNFEKFLNKLAKCNITEFASIENILVTGIKIEELNHVLNITLRDRLQVICEGTHMYIKGNYITTGDIIDILFLKRTMMDAKCKRLLSTNKTKIFNIFALNTFFIDDNINSSIINSHKIVLMSVIAPKWEIIGKNKIELRGNDGELTGVGYGMNGKPGKPGNPGGSFFGIGSEFVNGINLEISVNGGNGSPGQGGRKGEKGIDGTSPTTPPSNAYIKQYWCNDIHCIGNKKINDFNCEKIKCEYSDVSYEGGTYNVFRSCKYRVFGKSGTKGKNGGNGGKGGKGGYPGNIVLMELKNHSQISLVKNTGHNAEDGKGGAGGLGGCKGNEIDVECVQHCGWWRNNCWSLLSTKVCPEKAESGHKGVDGGNTDGMEHPKLAVVINNLEKAKIINQYKSYLRENLNDRFTNGFLKEFLKKLENNINVKKVYDTLGLIDDLEKLEEQFNKLNKDINYIQFYQSLLKRISEYALAPKEVGDPGQYKKHS